MGQEHDGGIGDKIADRLQRVEQRLAEVEAENLELRKRAAGVDSKTTGIDGKKMPRSNAGEPSSMSGIVCDGEIGDLAIGGSDGDQQSVEEFVPSKRIADDLTLKGDPDLCDE